jgi:ethanolamine ammonia-lyase large subunit
MNEKERLQKEIQAKKDAELKSIKDAEIKAEKERKANELAAKKAASASDKVKLTTWFNSIKLDEFAPENIKPESVKVANNIMQKLENFKVWAKSQIETL